jgi:hypothetical protein
MMPHLLPQKGKAVQRTKTIMQYKHYSHHAVQSTTTPTPYRRPLLQLGDTKASHRRCCKALQLASLL